MVVPSACFKTKNILRSTNGISLDRVSQYEQNGTTVIIIVQKLAGLSNIKLLRLVYKAAVNDKKCVNQGTSSI